MKGQILAYFRFSGSIANTSIKELQVVQATLRYSNYSQLLRFQGFG